MAQHSESQPICVAIVEPHPGMRDRIQAALQQASDIEVVGVAGDSTEALRLIEEQHPEVVLLEAHLPDGGGIALVLQTTLSHPEVALLAIARDDQPSHLRALLPLRIRGYLRKTAPGEAIAAAIRAAAEGLTVLGPETARALFEDNWSPFTAREREVLQLLLAGRRNHEIADALCTSVKTVEFHVRNVLAKLGAHSRVQAHQKAKERGIVPLPGLWPGPVVAVRPERAAATSPAAGSPNGRQSRGFPSKNRFSLERRSHSQR